MKNNDERVKYFGAGQAQLPQAVVEEVAQAVLDYNGLSILEIPHRSETYFLPIIQEASDLLLTLCQLDTKEYSVLWLQGGGRMQFAMLPMNFLNEGNTGAYVDSGYWAHDAYTHANYYGQAKIIASSKNTNYTAYPTIPNNITKEEFAYVHVTTNNTIYGTQLKALPPNISINIFADMSSDILAVDRDYSKFDLFYAVAQKNLGAAGVTAVVIKKSLLEQCNQNVPPILSYREQILQNSMINTPPVFSIFTSLVYLRWMKEKGITKLIKDTQFKADLIYNELERNSLLELIAEKESRSLTNIVFKASDEIVTSELIHYCKNQGIGGIEGHRRVGGFRVSNYHGNTIEDVQYLIRQLQQFEINYKQKK
jgi:phosphoserine aminotransferase